MSSEDGTSVTPPLIAFKTFLGLFDKFEQGTPNRIDRSFWRKYYSGTIGSQLIRGLHFLGLIEGEDNRVTPEFKRLAREKEVRKQLIGDMVRERYTPIFRDIGDLTEATHGQLEQAFKQHYKIDGENRRKAISFFVHAAQEAGMQISPFIRTATNPGSNRTATRRPRRTQTDSDNRRTPEPPPVDSDEQSDHQTAHAVKLITYPNGEISTLSYSGNVFAMEKKQRDFLFSLIDQMTEFERTVIDAGKSNGRAAESEENKV